MRESLSFLIAKNRIIITIIIVIVNVLLLIVNVAQLSSVNFLCMYIP